MPFSWPVDWIKWPVASQDVSRSNALHEAVACVGRRREREDVDRFLDEHRRGIPRQRTGSADESAAAPRATSAPSWTISRI